MHSLRTRTTGLALAALSLVFLLSACQASPTPTEANATSPVDAAPAITETTAPSATPTTAPSPTTTATVTATVTAVPTATATAVPTFGPLADGLSAWCLPENELLLNTADPANPPEYARLGEMLNGALEIRNLPVTGCVFIYTFNQPPPDGLKLAVYDQNQQAPWLTADLLPVEGSPNAAAVLLRHTYVTAPPLWDISYEFAVQDGNGTELRRDPVNFHRWVPALCWNGRRPNPITLRCPLPQDLHPWDAGYGTPMPTFPPSED